ncbi:hypothetical protein KW794_02095 [Candidatus Saccharibacteria bacterium]|nr:hypothetical protein [Candidatus Saccharibacteria bacterium]
MQDNSENTNNDTPEKPILNASAIYPMTQPPHTIANIDQQNTPVKKNGSKSLIVIIVLLIVLSAGGVFAYKHINSNEFKDITYNNGLGNTFSLSFYQNNKIGIGAAGTSYFKFYNNDLGNAAKSVTDKKVVYSLESLKSRSGKYPLEFYIVTLPDDQDANLSIGSCDTSNDSVKSLGKIILAKVASSADLCSLKSNIGNDTQYYFTFTAKQKNFLVVFDQYVVPDAHASSTSLSQKYGLPVYLDDVKRIAPTISLKS